jgi:hypothetical protein
MIVRLGTINNMEKTYRDYRDVIAEESGDECARDS